MAIELRQQLKLSQQLVMTPQLQMAIKLLQLPQLELIDHIRQELEANPALEEFQEQGQEMGVETSPDMPEDTGKITADSPLEEIRIEEKLKAMRKRGWGLKIIEGLMDEVEIRSDAEGTTIIMSKLR